MGPIQRAEWLAAGELLLVALCIGENLRRWRTYNRDRLQLFRCIAREYVLILADQSWDESIWKDRDNI